MPRFKQSIKGNVIIQLFFPESKDYSFMFFKIKPEISELGSRKAFI